LKTCKKYIRFQGIRFSRWTNKAYAIFNSISSVISIGNVTRLIGQSVTVKNTSYNHWFTGKNHEGLNPFLEEETLIDSDGLRIGLLEILSLEIQIRDLISAQKLEVAEETHIIETYKALFGPFFVHFLLETDRSPQTK
jgi:hypothetical protein